MGVRKIMVALAVVLLSLKTARSRKPEYFDSG